MNSILKKQKQKFQSIDLPYTQTSSAQNGSKQTQISNYKSEQSQFNPTQLSPKSVKKLILETNKSATTFTDFPFKNQLAQNQRPQTSRQSSKNVKIQQEPNFETQLDNIEFYENINEIINIQQTKQYDQGIFKLSSNDKNKQQQLLTDRKKGSQSQLHDQGPTQTEKQLEHKFELEEYQKFKQYISKKIYNAHSLNTYKRMAPEKREELNQKKSALFHAELSQKIQKKQFRIFKTREEIHKKIEQKKIFEQFAIKEQKNEQKTSYDNNPHQSTRKVKQQVIIDAIKEQSIKTMTSMITIQDKDRMIELVRQELLRATNEMSIEVEKLLLTTTQQSDEIYQLDQQLQEYEKNIVNLQEKNAQLIQHQKFIKQEYDQLKISIKELENFIPQYKILKNSCEDFSAQKIIDQIQKLENLIHEKEKQIVEIEDENLKLRNTKKEIQHEFEIKEQDLLQVQIKKEKQVDQYIKHLKDKETEIYDSVGYKEKYIELFNNLTQLFIKMQSNNSVYSIKPQLDGGPWTGLKDHYEMLEIMQRYHETSTPEKMQKYLRKIMVSANLLLRRYLPEFVNEQFDIEKIYERILSLMKKFESEIFQLKAENKELKRKQGLKGGSTLTQNGQIEFQPFLTLQPEEQDPFSSTQ